MIRTRPILPTIDPDDPDGGLYQTCEWFLLCDRVVTGLTPHPILGDVPTCDYCHHFATGEDR